MGHALSSLRLGVLPVGFIQLYGFIPAGFYQAEIVAFKGRKMSVVRAFYNKAWAPMPERRTPGMAAALTLPWTTAWQAEATGAWTCSALVERHWVMRRPFFRTVRGL